MGFVCAKIKAQIRCAVTAQLISTFVFVSLFCLNPKFQASSLCQTWSETMKTSFLVIWLIQHLHIGFVFITYEINMIKAFSVLFTNLHYAFTHIASKVLFYFVNFACMPTCIEFVIVLTLTPRVHINGHLHVIQAIHWPI